MCLLTIKLKIPKKEVTLKRNFFFITTDNVISHANKLFSLIDGGLIRALHIAHCKSQ